MAEFDVTISATESLQADFTDSSIEETATISADSTSLDVSLDNSTDLELSISPFMSIDAEFSEAINIDVQTPEYQGPYQVTPKSTSQTLATALLKMSTDVTIDAVPYTSTSNPQGGETITIL